MEKQKYVQISPAVEGVILTLEITKGSIVGNAIEVSHWLGGGLTIPPEGPPFITGQAGNDSYIAYNGDLILRHHEESIEVIRKVDLDNTSWTVDPRENKQEKSR